MFLKNYTSNTPVSKTIHDIEQVLIRCGVSGITKEYGPDAEITALQFHIRIQPNSPPVSIRLPADRESALQALWLDYADGEQLSTDGKKIIGYGSRKRLTRASFAGQAERTAWRIMKDWVEVQMSMIQMRQADFAEVFMAYVWNGRETFYQRIKGNGYRALLTEGTKDETNSSTS
mgnify:CR=1 FL=1